MFGLGSHSFTVVQNGTSTAGYCVVSVYDINENETDRYYVGKFGVGTPLTFTITVAPIEGHDVRALIKNSQIWGYYANTLQPLSENGIIHGFSVGEIISGEPDTSETTVQSAETETPSSENEETTAESEEPATESEESIEETHEDTIKNQEIIE